MCLVDEGEQLMGGEEGKEAEWVKNGNKEVILSFLRSKDDNLLLLVGGLIMSIQYNSSISPDLLL